MLSRSDQNGIIGVDIGTTSVKVVELDRSCGRYELAAAALAPVSSHASPPSVQHALASALESAHVQSKRVATSVSGGHVAVRTFKFPKLSHSELEGAVWYEGSQVIAFDIEDSYVDYTALRPASDEEKADTPVLFVAAMKPQVDELTELVQSVGLEPRLVSVDALALLEAVMQEHDAPETPCVVHIGATRTSIGAAREGGLPFVRDIDLAGNTYTNAVVESLGVTPEEAEEVKRRGLRHEEKAMVAVESVTRRLVGELARSLVYYQTRGEGKHVDTIYLCGGSSRIPGLDDAISRATSVPVAVWSPLDNVEIDASQFDPASLDRMKPYLSLAAALAMKSETC
ncbi:MAG: type IV pilus assembly protein PilM [Candidatus Eisenbacteria bacterium]|nr:type IV pilus assembly protein PilM [Candidatus Eisenbacteria bacterium]